MTVFVGPKRALLGSVQSIPSWVAPDAMLAMQFGRDQYWRKRGGILPATSVLATTRASGIILPNAAGVYQALGVNTLPRTDRGLYANGQAQNLLLWSQEFNDAAWLKTSGGTGSNPVVTQNDALAPDGTLTADRIDFDRGAGNTSADTSALTQIFSVPATGAYTGSNWIKAATAGDVGKQIVTRNVGGAGYLTITLTSDYQRIERTETASGTSGREFSLASRGTFSSSNQVSVHLWGAQVNSGIFAGPYTPTTTAAATTAASAITAVQGTRPSNGQPEPFPGWEAAGLDAACGGIAKVQIDRLSAASARFIAGAGVDANNLWRVIFDTDNRFKLIVRKSGSDALTLQTGVVGTLGLKDVTWNAEPGDYALTASGVADGTSASSETLPTGSTTLRIGSNFSVANPFNGWIEELQILRVA